MSVTRAIDFADQAAEHFAANPGKLFVPQSAKTNRSGPMYDSVEQAFPPVPVPYSPLGNLVTVMLRVPAYKTAGGMTFTESDRTTELDNTQIAKVVAVGPLAFCNRTTGELWPEKEWVRVGDFVRVPKFEREMLKVQYQAQNHVTDDRTGAVRTETHHDTVTFIVMKDLALIGRYENAEAAMAARAFF